MRAAIDPHRSLPNCLFTTFIPASESGWATATVRDRVWSGRGATDKKSGKLPVTASDPTDYDSDWGWESVSASPKRWVLAEVLDRATVSPLRSGSAVELHSSSPKCRRSQPTLSRPRA